MQEGRHQRIGVEFPAGTDLSNGDRVRNVGLAAVTELTEMRGVRESIRITDTTQIWFAEISLRERSQGGQSGDAARVGRGRKRGLGRGWTCGLFADELEGGGGIHRFGNWFRQAGDFPQTCPQTPQWGEFLMVRRDVHRRRQVAGR